ncbi:MAG TPA: fibronectin type III domain-containing protein [Candidatus Polarisedimenticolaceae bacterium]|nr:fibronectin type III domain-containing protein [Candidatus Polarisedimenticolaceae bacterium]
MKNLSGAACRRTIGALGAVLGAALWVSSGAGAAPGDVFPELRPLTRSQAVDLLAEPASHAACLTARLQSLRGGIPAGPATARRALIMLQRRILLSGEQVETQADGTQVHYTSDPGSPDRIDATDADHDGIPDTLQATLRGLEEARRLLVDDLELAAPERADVQLAELGEAVGGYALTADPTAGRIRLVLDATPATGPAGARRAAAHQFAHAVAASLGPAFPAEWGEALASWTTLVLDGQPDAATAALLSQRIERLGSGLLAADLDLAPGNALWLSFLQEAYGPQAVRLTVQELARGGSVSTALDRAIRHASPEDLPAAFREFQIWSLMVGTRADGSYFSFGSRLSTPGFASSADGLPALSVQSDAPVAPLGAVAVRLRPDARDGGLRVRFEGDLSATWEADLLLVSRTAGLRRLALHVSGDARAESVVPLDGLDEAWLLVRNVEAEDGLAHRYSYAAHREAGYPFELTALEARRGAEPRAGVLISWETSSERDLIGFNLWRVPEAGGTPVVINPVWIPAAGDASVATSYRFLDGSAEPGVTYVYRLEGVTIDGLSARSEPTSLSEPAAH